MGLLLVWFTWVTTLSGAAGPCDPLCADLSAETQRARCHSCRCKEAMGGWLPSPQELQCANTVEIPVFQSRPGQPLTLDPITTAVSECNNPSLFGGDCAPGSRLGQLVHGDVHVKWICRRKGFTSQYQDPRVPFDKVAIIATHTKTGATCFWDEHGGTLDGANLPNLDLTHATPAQLQQFTRHFTTTEGFGCVYCHDNDAFLFTPYLKGAGWQTGDYTTGPYARVMLQGPPQRTGLKQLVSPDAKACTRCHRITNGRTCQGWAADAIGHGKDYGYESSVIEALDQWVEENGTPKRRPGTYWQLAYWMPPGVDPKVTTWEKFHEKYGRAKDLVLKCCEEVNAGITSPECRWTPVP